MGVSADRMRGCVAGVLAVAVLAGGAWGQTTAAATGRGGVAGAKVSSGIPANLLAQVPENAVAVLYWAGTEAMGKTWSESKGAQAAGLFKIAEVFGRIGVYHTEKSDLEDPNALMLRALLGADDIAAGKPSLVAFVPSEKSGRFVTVHVMDGGKDVETLAKTLRDRTAKLPSRGASWRDGTVLVHAPYASAPPRPPKKGEVVAKFAETDWYKDAVGRMVEKPAMVILLQPRAALVPGGENERAQEALNNAGLGEGDYGVLSAAVEGTEWVSRGFVRSAAPRKGIPAAFLPGRKVSETLLRRVPAETTYFSSYRMDPNRILGGFKDLFGDDAEGGGQFARRGEQIKTNNPVEIALSGLSLALTVDVRNGLLRGLGPDWVLATVATKDGGKKGLVAMNRLTDAEKVRATLTGAGRAIDRLTLMVRKHGFERYRFATEQRPGITLFKLGPEGAGASTQAATKAAGAATRTTVWTIRDGLLVIGDDVDVVAAALATPAKSVVDSGRVKEIQGMLDAPDSAAVGFADIGASGGEGFDALVELAKYLDGVDPELKLEGLLPARAKAVELLKGVSVSAAWTDDAGYYFRSRGAFPGVELFSPLGVAVLRGLPESLKAERAAGKVRQGEIAPEEEQGGGPSQGSPSELPN